MSKDFSLVPYSLDLEMTPATVESGAAEDKLPRPGGGDTAAFHNYLAPKREDRG